MTRLFVAFALTHLVFATWPGIDLWVASWFHGSDGFALRDFDALERLRNVIWAASTVTALAALAAAVLWPLLGASARVPGRLWTWVVLVYAAAPGLLVNGVLKAHWGRGRPAEVFSGEAAFTPPFEVTDQCAGNCSFVSGEAAGATALAIVWTALVPGRFRRRTALAVGALAVAAGLMRVATGRHFLSDVLFAAFLTGFVAWALFRLLRLAAARDRLTLPALRHDVSELARRLRRLGRRVVS